MSASPLLDPGSQRDSHLGTLSRHIRAWRASLASWWAQTTAEKYLSEPLSRRHLWRYFPFGLLIALMVDAYCISAGTEPASILLPTYVPLVLVALALRLLPATSIRTDFIVVLMMASQFWLLILLTRNGIELIVNWVPILVFCCCLGGIHSSAVVLYLFSTGLLSTFRSEVTESGYSLTSLAFACFMLLALVHAERLTTFYFQELTRERASVQQLLDKVTSGNCVVNRQSGVVSRASPGMSELFGVNLTGLKLSDSAVPDDRQRLQSICSTTGFNEASAALSTFMQWPSVTRPAGAEFDAHVVPYRLTDSEVYVALQVVGETRVIAPSHPRPSDSSVAGHGESSALYDFPDDLVRSLSTLPSSSDPQPVEEPGEDLWIEFDSGHERMEIWDCSPELKSRMELVDWFPLYARHRLEEWVYDSMSAVRDYGECPGQMESFELEVPAVPAMKVRAETAQLSALPTEDTGGGSLAIPAVLRLSGVSIIRRGRAQAESALETVEEHWREDDMASRAGSEGMAPSESASLLWERRFRVTARAA